MRAVVLHGAGDLRIEEVSIPVPRPGELLLAVETVGICGTDASEYGHGPMQFPVDRRHPVTGHLGPLIPGHEFSGTVAGRGPGVDGFSEGELVASAGSTGCGNCGFCESGRPSRCLRYWAVGLHANGALAEYCTVPASACLSVGSEGLTADEAALAQPMSIAVHALARGRIEGGEDVVVIGAGGIGAFVTYALASAGCNVTVVDLDRGRLEIASALGGSDTLVPGPDFDHSLEAAVVFEITGSKTGLSTALTVLGPGGRLVAVGFQKQRFDADFEALTTGEQEWVGTNRIDKADLPEAIRLLAARDAAWSDVAPQVLPLDDVEGALSAMARGAEAPIKTLISPRADQPRPSRM